MSFSDYIVYADEAGSPVLSGGDPDFPVFVLACVLIRKDDYTGTLVPRLQRLKFEHVGHDQIVLHERDVRRQQKDFAFLQVNPAQRNTFLESLTDFVADAPMYPVSAVIFKEALKAKYADPWSPYEIALHFCMERILDKLLAEGQEGRLVHFIFEARGKNEDRELELQFRRIAAGEANWGWRNPPFRRIQWEPRFVDKKANTSGLQLADLIARPTGLGALRPLQTNRAYEAVRAKYAFNCNKRFP